MALMKNWITDCLVAASAIAMLTGCTVKTDDVVRAKWQGMQYEGQMKNGKPDGLGTLTQGDSVVYSGMWHKGLRQGRGWCSDSTGRRIEGQWSKDTLTFGVRHDSTGTYSGEFNRNLMAYGYGVMRDKQDRVYEGFWKNDKRHGFGFSSQQRFFQVGEWKNNVYKGERLNYTASRIYGIDLSKYQHEKGKHRYGIDWSNLRITHLGTLSKKNISGKVDYKVSFIFIKSTEGSSLFNPYYPADYAASRKHGFATGTYHYFTHRSSGAQQAAFFLAKSHVANNDLPPVIDLELLPSQIAKMGGAGRMWQQVRIWLRNVERRTGKRPILYISQTFVNRYLDGAPDIKHNYPIWIARYGEYKPDIKLQIWQLAPDGRVKGIHGLVDINVYNGYKITL